MTTQATSWTRASWAKAAIVLAMTTAAVSAQTPRPTSQTPKPAQTQQTPPSTPVFKAGTDIISIDVYPRDARGQFVPNLTRDDFVIYEDGVEQTLQNFIRANGAQFYNDLATTSAMPVSEGLILPKAAPPADTAGRIFIIFVDDLHFMASQTPLVRRLLAQVRDTVIHENDLVGFVSSGTSSIELSPAYDYQHRRFNEVINKVVGSSPTIESMINMRAGLDGLSELNHNVAVAFQTAYNLLTQLEEIRDKRKAFIMISNGYSLDPFKDSRLKRVLERYTRTGACDSEAEQDPQPFTEDPRPRNDPCRYVDADMAQIQNPRIAEAESGFDLLGQPTLQWKEGDLMSEMAQLIRTATRANTMFFPLDPRGLISGFNDASMQQALSNQEESLFIQQTVGSLQALAENTGGIACVGTNDCRPVLQKIDNMTSDYYMLGYRSSNPDPFRVARKIEIKVKRPGVELVSGRDYRDTYYLKRPARNPKK
jgi:VWFA-related protein